MEQKKYKVIRDRVLILPDEKETQTKSGMVLPPEMQKKPNWGTVIAVGDGIYIEVGELVYRVDALKVKEGDRVMFERHTAVPVEGTDYVIIKEFSILLID